ncbi:hypothetical protein STCU_11252 [Strigomonas culicis]|uniref:Amastin-like protein n=1 Tax=Strigomonas culicis TaxID=28005 RepID=S9TJ88_9TRYP|nr:hypothetical protein STCU_11252 [Strigomonas culicis]|eukprot:EPY16448.1 hypothetical protein STCU_11252 [Strigomonas culicis]
MKITTSVTPSPQETPQKAAKGPARRHQEDDDSYYYYSSSHSAADQESNPGGAAAEAPEARHTAHGEPPHAEGDGDQDGDGAAGDERRLLFDYVFSGDDRSSSWTRYLFPRMDRRLINYQFEQDNKEAAGQAEPHDPARKQNEDGEPPNAIELFIAYVMAADLRLTLCAAFVLLSMVFTVAAIPLSQVDIPGNQCYTLFGYKANCDRSVYTTNVQFITCSGVHWRLETGAAFIIIALIVELCTILGLILMVFCAPIRRKKVLPFLPQQKNGQQTQVKEG